MLNLEDADENIQEAVTDVSFQQIIERYVSSMLLEYLPV